MDHHDHDMMHGASPGGAHSGHVLPSVECGGPPPDSARHGKGHDHSA